MRKSLLFITLCVANISFAQLKVSNVGNASIGNVSPLSNTQLYLYNSVPYAGTYGLYSFLENTNIPQSASSSLYGAYFKNKLTGTLNSIGKSYGIYVDNENAAYNGTTYGFYANNNCSHASGTEAYGFYANNTTYSNIALYGIRLSNTGQSTGGGGVYGIYSTNTSAGNNSSVYGAYLSATRTSTGSNSYAYGIYAAVSGANTNVLRAGYFTGAKVIMTNAAGSTIGLEVQGDVWANGNILNSDERLKTEIKPLSDEKDKLYLLQGKSYKKKPRPLAAEEDSLAKNMEIIETPEYGYLAQELEKIFPDLVSQDSAGYYGVNYIGLIPVIVEALKDQQLESEKKQIQIEELKEQIKQLVKLMDIKSINEEVFEENGIESIPILLQNTPNPFNQATEIGYYIPENTNSANIYIYDINGFQQRNISISERGKGATILQASALQAGIYFYTLICDGKPVDTKQMILTR